MVQYLIGAVFVLVLKVKLLTGLWKNRGTRCFMGFYRAYRHFGLEMQVFIWTNL